MNLLEKFHHWRRKLRWDRQYKSGRWESLKKEKEAPRYKQIVAYIKKFAGQNPSILDIGCGNGALNKYLSKTDFSTFTGVDFSKVSIEEAKNANYPKTEFEVGDAIYYTPKQEYDVIIFNETFYYIPISENKNVLDRAVQNLTPNGIIIISIYREGVGCWEHFKENENLKELAFTTVTTDEELRYWKVGVYGRKR